jgi:hypothetical protein
VVELVDTEATHRSAEVHIPQRNKEFVIDTYGVESWCTEVNAQLSIKLPLMESQFEDSRQLYKFNRIQNELTDNAMSSQFVSVILNNGAHQHIALLSQWMDLYLYGVYDVVNKGVRLVWTDDAWFVSDARAYDYTRYVFYRFPVLQDRPLFLYSQALCSKWWGWTKQFQEPDGVLKAFNALENFLFKEPELPTLSPDAGNAT